MNEPAKLASIDVVLADVDGNQVNDLLSVDTLTSGANVTTSLTMRLRKQDDDQFGTWDGQELGPLGAGGKITSIAAGNVDGQKGHSDVVALSSGDERRVLWWHSTDGKTWQQQTVKLAECVCNMTDPSKCELEKKRKIAGIALGDADGDGDLDVAVASFLEGHPVPEGHPVQVPVQLLELKNGSFQERTDWARCGEGGGMRVRFLRRKDQRTADLIVSNYRVESSKIECSTRKTGTFQWGRRWRGSPNGPANDPEILGLESPLACGDAVLSSPDFDVQEDSGETTRTGATDGLQFAVILSAHHCGDNQCWLCPTVPHPRHPCRLPTKGGFAAIVKGGRAIWTSESAQAARNAERQPPDRIILYPRSLRFMDHGGTPSVLVGYGWAQNDSTARCWRGASVWCPAPFLLAAIDGSSPRFSKSEFFPQAMVPWGSNGFVVADAVSGLHFVDFTDF